MHSSDIYYNRFIHQSNMKKKKCMNFEKKKDISFSKFTFIIVAKAEIIASDRDSQFSKS